MVARWVDALRPVAGQLKEPLNAVFHDEKRRESERTLAASALAEYLSDRPDELAELLMDASEKSFAALYPSVESRSDQTAPRLEAELAKKPTSPKGGIPTDLDKQAWEKLYQQQANAAVALIRMGRMAKSWPLLKHSPDPSLRSDLVHRLGPLGVEPGLLIARLDQEGDVSIRRAVILSLGAYGEGQISTAEREVWTKKLLDLYRNDPDPGIHGAADWLLRQWRSEPQLQAIDNDLVKLPHPTLEGDRSPAPSRKNRRGWYVNSQGETMVIVRGPVEFDMGERGDGRRERIGYSFAIANKEVTVEQFQRFLKENPRIQAIHVQNNEQVSPAPTCPMNSVAWYQAAAYCNWLSQQEGFPEDQWSYGPNEKGDYAEGMKLFSDTPNRMGYRLPTEAEWEYSCRAGAATEYSFGEPWGLLKEYGWYVSNSPNRTRPVGMLKPNDLGLFDLHGNIWEWCQDRYRTNGQESERIIISSEIKSNNARLLRGGSFTERPANVRSAVRLWSAPSNRNSYDGFRPARTYR